MVVVGSNYYFFKRKLKLDKFDNLYLNYSNFFLPHYYMDEITGMVIYNIDYNFNSLRFSFIFFNMKSIFFLKNFKFKFSMEKNFSVFDYNIIRFLENRKNMNFNILYKDYDLLNLREIREIGIIKNVNFDNLKKKKKNLNIFINSFNSFFLEIDENLSVIENLLLNSIEIPRFCYHKKLSIAGNCRMCLVEVSKSIKPIASCAVKLVKGIKIYTNSFIVKKGRENILEFLLINHPLDCPICDQGGECDLQDQSLVFGGDKGRFYNYKRAVTNKNCSSFVKMLMTRCIHCTRCIRFINEISGLYNLGMINRGENMEISTYINNFIDSEISGNIIDLCPVGALTSKTLSFNIRSWELKKFTSIDIFDSYGSDISISVFNNKIMRILPCLNNFWISDKIRFFYDSINIQRIYSPLIRLSTPIVRTRYDKLSTIIYKRQLFNFIPRSWFFVFFYLKNYIVPKITNKCFKVILGDLVDCETLIIMKDFMNKKGFNNYGYSIINDKNFNDFRFFYIFNNDFLDIDFCFFLCLDLRLECPLLNIMLRKNILKYKVNIFSLGYNLNMSYFVNQISNNFYYLKILFEGKNWVCNIIKKCISINFIYGNGYLIRKDSYDLLDSLYFFLVNKNLYLENKNININSINIFISIINYLELNFISRVNINLIENVNNNINNIYYLIGSYITNFNNMKNCINGKNYIIFQGHHGDDFVDYTDVILPGTTFLEKSSLFLNYKNELKKTKQCIIPFYKSRYDWEIIKYFALTFDLSLNYYSLMDIRQRLIKYSSLFYLNLFEINNSYSNLKFSNIILNKFKLETKYFLLNFLYVSIVYDYYKTNIFSQFSVNLTNFNISSNFRILKNKVFNLASLVNNMIFNIINSFYNLKINIFLCS